METFDISEELVTVETKVHEAKKLVDLASMKIQQKIEDTTSAVMGNVSSALFRLQSTIERTEAKIQSVQSLSTEIIEDLKAGVDLAVVDLTTAIDSAKERLETRPN